MALGVCVWIKPTLIRPVQLILSLSPVLIIDAMVGCERLSFLDAYPSYHQIKMAVKDQEKTSYITPFGAFCYLYMPFGLKSAQVTYEHCV